MIHEIAVRRLPKATWLKIQLRIGDDRFRMTEEEASEIWEKLGRTLGKPNELEAANAEIRRLTYQAGDKQKRA